MAIMVPIRRWMWLSNSSIAMDSSIQGHKEWINEVNFLDVVKHPNLVKLVGYCAEDGERGIHRLLVYELMHNKSLEDHLMAWVASPLPWMARLKIAQDGACGLAYLHEEMDFRMLLDMDFFDLFFKIRLIFEILKLQIFFWTRTSLQSPRTLGLQGRIQLPDQVIFQHQWLVQ